MKINEKQKHIAFLVVLILAVVALIISVFENFGITNWHSVYKSVGIKEVTDVVGDYDLSAHFIDVGKADSIYINCKNKNILIDGGEHDTYNTVLEYLKKLGIKNLDLVIATHPHSDHIGGLPEVLNEFKVFKIFMPKVKDSLVPTSKIYEKFLLAIEKNKIPVKVPTPGETVTLGELEIKVLAPNGFYDNVNNHSIVVKIVYKDVRFLFTGDAEKESENDILRKNYDIKSTVLKVGHHGSKTSTTKEFLRKVSPKYAVICVGEDKYNLPKKETITKLKECGAEIYRTDLDGDVVIATNGKADSVKIVTSKN